MRNRAFLYVAILYNLAGYGVVSMRFFVQKARSYGGAGGVKRWRRAGKAFPRAGSGGLDGTLELEGDDDLSMLRAEAQKVLVKATR